MWEGGREGGGVFLLASRLSEFFMWHPVGLGTKCQPASGMAHQTLVLLGKRGGGGEEGGEEGGCTRRELFVLVCYCNTNKMYTCIYELSLSVYLSQTKNMCTCTRTNKGNDMQTHTH